MAVTQQDIAKRLGVSQRLVSYALNGHACVGDEMRVRIKQEADALGYRPHRAAQALVTGRTHQIALCFRFLGSSFHTEVIRQFEILARDTPYDLLMLTLNPTDTNRTNVQFTADGTIFMGPAFFLRSKHMAQSVVRPVVAIQNQLRLPDGVETDDEEFDRIEMHFETASQDVMEHLLAQGLRRIAYVAPFEMMGLPDLRYWAYRQAMEDAGLPLELITLPVQSEELIRQQSHLSLKEYFGEHGFPEALFCCNDDIGIGAYRALGELDRRVPEETAVIGFDDLDYAQYMHPPMSSVYMPVEEVCRRAWEMLMQRIEGDTRPPHYESFNAKLVIRKSSRKKPVAELVAVSPHQEDSSDGWSNNGHHQPS
jgi:LacI family transcriptional regulator